MDQERLERLGQLVESRRRQRGWPTRQAFSENIGLTYRVLTDLENGARKLGNKAYAEVEFALGWAPGSIDAILDGGEPTVAERPGSPAETANRVGGAAEGRNSPERPKRPMGAWTLNTDIMVDLSIAADEVGEHVYFLDTVSEEDDIEDVISAYEELANEYDDLMRSSIVLRELSQSVAEVGFGSRTNLLIAKAKELQRRKEQQERMREHASAAGKRITRTRTSHGPTPYYVDANNKLIPADELPDGADKAENATPGDQGADVEHTGDSSVSGRPVAQSNGRTADAGTDPQGAAEDRARQSRWREQPESKEADVPYVERLDVAETAVACGVTDDVTSFRLLWVAGWRPEHAPILRSAMTAAQNKAKRPGRGNFWKELTKELGGTWGPSGAKYPPPPAHVEVETGDVDDGFAFFDQLSPEDQEKIRAEVQKVLDSAEKLINGFREISTDVSLSEDQEHALLVAFARSSRDSRETVMKSLRSIEGFPLNQVQLQRIRRAAREVDAIDERIGSEPSAQKYAVGQEAARKAEKSVGRQLREQLDQLGEDSQVSPEGNED